MRISELKLIRFGKFTDRTLHLPNREQDIHIIVGPNEAGKSTVRTAIGDWLFGIPMRTPLGFLHPMPDLRLGGVLEKLGGPNEAGQRLAFDRTKGNKNTLRTPGDASLPEAALQPWLAGLQAQAFNRMYALDHTTLVEGGAGILSASDDIGRMLFQSAAGVEHLGEALQQLQVEADALWAPRKSSARVYYQALDAYETAHAQFKQATLRTKDWTQRHDALSETEAALTEARKREVEIRQQLSRLERIRRVRPMLLALDGARSRRDELMLVGDTPLLADNASQVLDAATRDMALIKADLLRLQEDLKRTQSELDNTHIEQSMLALAADITELSERRLQYRAHRTDLLKRTEEVRVEWLRVQELGSDLGWEVADEDLVRQRLPAAPVRSRLVRLLKDRTDVAQALRIAQSNFTERQQQVQQAQRALESLSAKGVHPGLAAALEQALKLGDHVTASADLQQQVAELSHRIEDGLHALGLWRKEPDALMAMVVPQAAIVQGLLDQHRSDVTERQSLLDALDLKTQEIQRQELELQQLVREFQPVSLGQVQAARQIRDETWRGIKAAPQALAGQADVFEGHMADADGLADARLDRAQHQADRQAKLARLEQQRLEQQNLEARSQAVQMRMTARVAEWDVLTSTCGLPQLPLEIALVWIQQREVVLDLLTERAQAERQLSNGVAAAARIQHALWTMLGGESSDQPGPELAECVRQARNQITQADQARGQRDTLEQQLQGGQSSLGTLQTTVQTAQTAWDAWEQSWQAAALSAGYDDSVSADQVEAEMAVMQELERRLERIRSIRSERIDPMHADLEWLAITAKSLAERLAPELATQSAEDITLELAQRLERSRQEAAICSGLQQRLERAQAEQAAALQRQMAVHASLAPLMTAAGVREVDALGPVVERSDKLRDIENKIQTVHAELEQAADGLSEGALRAEIDAIDPDALKAQVESLTELSNKAVEEIASLSNNFGTQKTAFEAFAGTDGAAQAEARRQEAIAAMGEAAERYLKVHTAARLLKWSMEKFRETKQGPMLAKATAIFSGLTRGSFSRLLVDAEESTPRLFGIRPDGQQVEVSGMSEGSRDQLYLALRLAALELQIDQGLSMPLIVDDLFINFDDSRTAAGLQVLGDLSRKMQIVFLTHHDHLVPLAKEVLGSELNVVYL
ncbi:ATP-binding protein [Hydrogenophaga taeniospiralis]|uniref:ATP-binding protein n=1 Tax=Hydrogenophaga taeniospiralis TaxID=65656 RepID=UPI001CFB5BE8|nr:YhaN family protein [Hydrogenophaga taeniospiralis]UCU92327.1 AAA family ATPase [Hydrogenophaga taeniospiralis]